MTFGTIIADPPWSYDKASRNDRKNRGYASYRTGEGYPLLDTEALCGLPVADLGASVLLLWTTGPFMPDAIRVVQAWGFEWMTMACWGKTRKDGGVHGGGVGFWFRGASEYIAVGVRKGFSSVRTNEPGLYLSPKLGHSAKPEWMHEVAERHFPGPYLELFGRREREGWAVLGNEAPGDGLDIRESIAKLQEVKPCSRQY